MDLIQKALNIPNIIDRADFVAEYAHKNQRRKYTKEPYIVHPRRVASEIIQYYGLIFDNNIIAMLWQEIGIVAATKLHDVLEDTKIDEETLRQIFPDTIVNLVVELTDPSKKMDINKTTRKERKKVDREHLKNVSSEAKIIKLCDRIDNLKDMSEAPPSFLALYKKESAMLAEVIGDVDEQLKQELLELCK